MLQALDADEKSLLAEQRLEVSLLEEIRKYMQMPRPQPPEQRRGVKRARGTADLDAQPSNDESVKEPESAFGHVIEDTLCQSHDVVEEPIEDTLVMLMTDDAEEPQAASSHEPSGHDLSTTQTGTIAAMSEPVKTKPAQKRKSVAKRKLFDAPPEKLNLGHSQCVLKFSPSKATDSD